MNEQITNTETEQQAANGTQQPPTLDGTQQPPTLDGTQQPPMLDGTQQPPMLDASQMPTLNASQMPMMPPPPMLGMQQGFVGGMGFGGMQQPPMAPPSDMWGNAEFAGNDMLDSNNFTPGFGGQSDLSGIVDGGTEISVNIGEQNNFANFAQGGMMPPPMFGGQGGQFNQAPQQAAQTQAE